MDQKDLEDGEVIDGESDEELSVLKIVPPDRFKNFNWEQNTQEFERDCVKYKNRQKRSSFSSNSSLGRFIVEELHPAAQERSAMSGSQGLLSSL